MPFSVIILAGGQSRRMGKDKAGLAWGQEDVLHSLVNRLMVLSEDVVVVSHLERTLPPTVRQVADIIPGKGPLSGIHAGLTAAQHELAFVTACDTPFLEGELVLRLVEAVGEAAASVVVYKEKIEPLFACYRKSCLPILEELLLQEQYRVQAFLEQLHWVPVSNLEGLSEWCFMNVNTPEEYVQAQKIRKETSLKDDR